MYLRIRDKLYSDNNKITLDETGRIFCHLKHPQAKSSCH